MRLGTRGRYAVMAMADLARHGVTDTRGATGASPTGASPMSAPRAGSVTLADIAARQEISQAYLEQLFAALRRAGLVASVRGPGGGYRLARPAAEVSVAEVVRAVDEPLSATRCEGKATGCLGGGERCATHDLWDALGGHIEGFLASVSLEDVVARRVRRPAETATGADAASQAVAA